MTKIQKAPKPEEVQATIKKRTQQVKLSQRRETLKLLDFEGHKNINFGWMGRKTSRTENVNGKFRKVNQGEGYIYYFSKRSKSGFNQRFKFLH